MLKTIVPGCVEFKDGVPYFFAAGDAASSVSGGVEQARHVFLQGCGLPAAWANRPDFVILETGFDCGLNFLMTWAAWRVDPARPARLHFLSVEKHPFRIDDLTRLQAQWPEFAELSKELLASWPTLTPGFHRIALDGGRVQLTLVLGEVASCLPQIQPGVDAFFLSGLVSDGNPDFPPHEWLDELARLAKPTARLAAYTVAPPVTHALTRAGFVCEARAGHGRAQDCLSAHFSARSNWIEPNVPQHVVVIGAGVAGAALAYALAQRGVFVTLLERAEGIGQGASGNPVAVFRPLVSCDDNRASRLTRAAFLHDLRAWTALDGVEWSRCGVLHLAKDANAAIRQQQALAGTAPPDDYARWVERDAACKLANWPVTAPGVFYPTAGWVVPGSLCRAWLDHPAIRVRMGCSVARVQVASTGWRVLDEGGAVLAEADAVVLANARDALSLVPGQPWPINTVRGQITQLPSGCLSEIQRVISREGYVAPGAGQILVGATYEHDDDDTTPRAMSDRANLTRLEAILPGAGERVVGTLSGRASLRATLPDRLPIVGEVHGHNNLYVAAGYASRGVVWAGLLGEALADQITRQPLPLEADLMGAISPQRFTR